MNGTAMLRRSRQQIRFGNEDMDFCLQWMLGYHTYGGASSGELFYAASKVEDGDPESWISAFGEMGARLKEQAEKLETAGKTTGVQQAYLRAFSGYRAAAQMMNPQTDFARFSQMVAEFKACFERAREGFEHPCEPIEVPFEDANLTGYFYRAGDGREPRPTLIMIGGGDTYVEDLHFWAGVPAPRRGYNALTVDLPGQGFTPARGLHLRTDPEEPLRAVVDYALSLPEVDAERLAAYGISGGGFFVTRAVSVERRIRAAIADTPIHDIWKVVTESVPTFLLEDGHGGLSGWLLGVAERFNKVGRNNMAKFAWQSGKGSLLEALQVSKGDSVDVEAIECPMLCLAAEGDPLETLVQTREVYERLQHPKKAMRILTAEEGAAAHCHPDNFPLLHQVLFDWLDETFA
jgi:pimeloyl-ACP methyl ester carboxylesterase